MGFVRSVQDKGFLRARHADYFEPGGRFALQRIHDLLCPLIVAVQLQHAIQITHNGKNNTFSMR